MVGEFSQARADTYHLAIASWYNIDFLVTWNCSHPANGFIIRELKKINLDMGVKTPEICTPEELMEVLKKMVPGKLFHHSAFIIHHCFLIPHL
jgi:hypothetical protein